MKNATGPAGVLDIPAGQLAARVERVLAYALKAQRDPMSGVRLMHADAVLRILDGEEDK
jgi:hypothetical protein